MREILLVTSIVRRAPLTSPSGFVSFLSWPGGDILLRQSVPESPFRSIDPNPRGGLRGARGCAFFGERCVIGNPDRLFIFDPGWRCRRSISHPLLTGVHAIQAAETGFWVTSTGCDLLLEFSWSGELRRDWSWRDSPNLASALAFPEIAPIDRSLDYRDPRLVERVGSNVAHLNSVRHHAGEFFLLLGRLLSPKLEAERREAASVDSLPPSSRCPGSRSVILRLDHGREAAIHLVSPRSIPCHDLIRENDHLIFNDTERGELVFFHRASEEESDRIRVTGPERFTRGLLHLDSETFLVGTQGPAALQMVDREARRAVREIRLSSVPNESVFGIYRVPESFADLPERLSFPAELKG